MKKLLPLTLLGTLPLLNPGKSPAAGRYYTDDRGKRSKAVLTVTTLADDGPGSLRDAITQANALPGLDEIRFAVTGTIPVGLPLAVTDDLHVTGPGSDLLTLDGGGLDRVFDVFDPEALVFGGEPEVFEARISGLTIANGQAPYYTYEGTRYFYDAGGVLALEVDLTLEDVHLRGNFGAVGGAVYFRADLPGDLPQPPTMTVRDCRFTDNVAIAGGGGMIIADTGRPGLIERSRFSGNTALIGLPEGVRRASDRARLSAADSDVSPNGLVGLVAGGGGFSSGDLDHEIAIVDSTFDRNTGYLGGAIRSSAADGGGIRLERSSLVDNLALIGGGIGSFYIAETSQMHVFNSTVSGNAAALGSGFGAIFIYPGSNERKLEFDHVTMVGNTTYQDPGTVFLYDARLDGTTPIVVFGNTVIGANQHQAGAGRGLEPATVDLNLGLDVAIESRYSAFSAPATADLIDVGTGNLFGNTGTFSPLVSGTGLTPVHLPQAGGPLANAADPGSMRFATDQRGLPRLAGGRSDIGAVEVDALGGAPEFDADPAAGTAFRMRSLETVRTERQLRVSNFGSAMLDLQVPELAAPFAIEPSGPQSLLPGETRTFVLSCTPTSNGLVTATLVIANNDPDEDPATFPIECGAVGTALPVPLMDGRPWQVLAALLLAIAGFRFGAWRRLGEH